TAAPTAELRLPWIGSRPATPPPRPAPERSRPRPRPVARAGNNDIAAVAGTTLSLRRLDSRCPPLSGSVSPFIRAPSPAPARRAALRPRSTAVVLLFAY